MENVHPHCNPVNSLKRRVEFRAYAEDSQIALWVMLAVVNLIGILRFET
jgi:hypothetical protein